MARKVENNIADSSETQLPQWKEISPMPPCDSGGNSLENALRAKSKINKFRGYLEAEVETNRTDVLLLACCLVSGFVDSTLYNAYFTFVSMQTGNTIFVGLGASGQNPRPYGWARSLMSILCFILGSLFFSRFVATLGSRKRLTLVASFLIQSVLIFVAAVIIDSGLVDGLVPSASDDTPWSQLAPISLLSFQAAGQIVGSRSLGLGEIPTVVITSLLCDLFSDPALTADLKSNVKRNRRVAAFILTLSGAIAGGWISKVTSGVQSALWVAGGIKGLITLAWLVWSTHIGST